MIKDKIEWLNEVKGNYVCDALHSQIIRTEKEVLDYELNVFFVTMKYIQNDIDNYNYISDLQKKNKSKESNDYFDEQIDLLRDDVIDKCLLVDDFYSKDKLIKMYESAKGDCSRNVANIKKKLRYNINPSIVNDLYCEQALLDEINLSLDVLNGTYIEKYNLKDDSKKKSLKLK